MSGYQDSNLGPPAPKAGALTGLRYIPKSWCKSSTLFWISKIKSNFFAKYFNFYLPYILLQCFALRQCFGNPSATLRQPFDKLRDRIVFAFGLHWPSTCDLWLVPFDRRVATYPTYTSKSLIFSVSGIRAVGRLQAGNKMVSPWQIFWLCFLADENKALPSKQIQITKESSRL